MQGRQNTLISVQFGVEQHSTKDSNRKLQHVLNANTQYRYRKCSHSF